MDNEKLTESELQELKDFLEMVEHAAELDHFKQVSTVVPYVRKLIDKLL